MAGEIKGLGGEWALEIRVVEDEEREDAIDFLNDMLYRPSGMPLIEDSLSEGSCNIYVAAYYGDWIVSAGKLSLEPPVEMLEQSGLWEVVDKAQYEGKVAMFRGVATLEGYRNLGLARLIYSTREELAIQHGREIGLALRRRKSAKRMYESLGYTVLKEEPLSPELIQLIGERDYVYKMLKKD